METALAKGIRHVGIGKHGSKPISLELVEECLAELKSGTTNDLQKGVFFGALMMKGPTDAELKLEEFLGKHAFNNPVFFLNKLCPHSCSQLV